MAEKDIAEKNLEAWNDVFADIVNVLIFNGEKVVKESELESDSSNSQFKVDGFLHEQERDVSKIWKKNEIKISIIGFENQTKQDYKMPLRIISYDGASYKQQLLDEKTKKHYPVITLVLYFGTDSKWTAPKNLYDCIKCPERLRTYVNDYKINVFEIAWLDDKVISQFKSDFKFIAKYFQSKRLNKEYEPNNDIIHHVDTLLKTFSALTDDNRFERFYTENNLKKKGGITMCDFIDNYINKGIEKGREEEKTKLIRNLIESNAGSIEQIADWVKLPINEVQKIAEKVPVSK